MQPAVNDSVPLVIRLTKRNVQVLDTTLFVNLLLVAASLWFGLRGRHIQIIAASAASAASAAVFASSLAPIL